MATISDKQPDFAAPKLKSKDSDVHHPNSININASMDSTDSLDDLLPPSKLYAGKNGDKSNIDADLDAMLEIDMDDVTKQKLKRRAEHGKNSDRKKKISCCKFVKIGNTIVWNQALYKRWRIGMIGPHWCGVLFTLALLLFASYYFTMKAYHDVGIISAGICIWLTVQATISLFLVACRDPGIVLDADICAKLFGEDALSGPGTSHRGGYSGLDNHAQGEEEGWRYCGVCEVYQPPEAAHCPDCNVCVDEYDHHCPWMGCCVGKDNYRDFMVFNMTWLVYLIYACTWVTALGPQLMEKVADSGEE